MLRPSKIARWSAAGLVVAILVAWLCIVGPRNFERVDVFSTHEAFDCGQHWITRQYTRLLAGGIGVEVECVKWPASPMHRPATPIAMVHGQDTFAPQWIEIPDCHHGETRTAIASGFPMLCVIGRGVTARPHPLQPKETSWSRALPVNADVGPIDPLKLRALPFRPMPLGLVVNTVFWTSIVILLWTGAKWLAARMRRTPGTCPRCRYDLRGRLEDGCSECGWGRSAPVGCGAGDQATMEHRRSPGSGASTANA